MLPKNFLNNNKGLLDPLNLSWAGRIPAHHSWTTKSLSADTVLPAELLLPVQCSHGCCVKLVQSTFLLGMCNPQGSLGRYEAPVVLYRPGLNHTPSLQYLSSHFVNGENKAKTHQSLSFQRDLLILGATIAGFPNKDTSEAAFQRS